MLVTLLRASICGGEIDDITKNNLTEENLTELYKLSKKHDVSHIIADVLYKRKLMPDYEISAEYKNYLMVALIRYQQITYELARMCDLFEKNKIPHIPLKGAYIRQYYPEPWLRTSCDIDILVKPDNLEQAEFLLVNELGYKKDRNGSHDIAFYSDGGLHIELHFKLTETDNNKSGKARRWNGKELENIWDSCHLVENKKYHYAMSDDMFYLYHIIHMANHIEEGGCGIRPFVDLWILDNVVPGDTAERKRKIESANLTDFYDIVQSLTKFWFKQEICYEKANVLASFVINGGVYGNLENRILSYTKIKGGKVKYFIHRLFPSYHSLKHRFPVLKTHKWLLPICYAIRAFDFVFIKKTRKPSTEFKVSNKISTEMYEEVSKLFDDMGLLEK